MVVGVRLIAWVGLMAGVRLMEVEFVGLEGGL